MAMKMADDMGLIPDHLRGPILGGMILQIVTSQQVFFGIPRCKLKQKEGCNLFGGWVSDFWR